MAWIEHVFYKYHSKDSYALSRELDKKAAGAFRVATNLLQLC